MAQITVNDKKVLYSTGGKEWEPGLPVAIFLHGAGQGQSSWVLQARTLAHHGWNVASPDLPGYGQSENQEDILTIEDHSDWTVDFMAALGAKNALLLGHSLGGGIATTLAARSPPSVLALVLVGTQEHMTVNDRLLQATRDNPEEAVNFISNYVFNRSVRMGGAANPGTWQHGTAEALLHACPAPVLHRDFKASHQWDGSAYAPLVKCPTLVVMGEGDRMTRPKLGRALAAAIPGAEFSLVPGAGHSVMSEAPRPFLKILRAFLANLPG